MHKKTLSKFIAIILIAGLNCLGFWAVIQAKAFFNDSETTKISSFFTSSLDFSLESDNDFLPELVPDINAYREIRVINDSDMDLRYDIGIDFVNGNDGLCQVLDLEVIKNGVLLSTSSLANFSLNNLYLATSTLDILEFTVVLNSNDYGYWSKVCEFDFIFDGEQTGKKGFSDLERISNIVTSGIWENIADYLVINKVYYDVDDAHGREDKNEWIELFNPTDKDISIKKWEICNHNTCAKINASTTIEAGAYILISHDLSTWKYWEIPDNIQTINALGGQFEMANDADMLILKDNYGNIIDQMNWGKPNENWDNYNSNIWNPAVATTSEGNMLGRVPSGYDTDAVSDWKDLSLPTVEVLSPNGGEVWYIGHTEEIYWSASSTNESADSELTISLYYSNNSGRTWCFIATTTNTGYYFFRLPLFLEDFTYYVPSGNARIKVVAVGPENFMVQNSDESDKDYCPPIDYGLLTEKELEMLKKLGLYNEADKNNNASGELLDLSVELVGENTVETRRGASVGEDPEEAEIADEDLNEENIELDENADLDEYEETVETHCNASDPASNPASNPASDSTSNPDTASNPTSNPDPNPTDTTIDIVTPEPAPDTPSDFDFTSNSVSDDEETTDNEIIVDDETTATVETRRGASLPPCDDNIEPPNEKITDDIIEKSVNNSENKDE
ncbi:lamin tail domain-containing protein [Candidatus Parcubacteria bacterium]|nr:lamin tail domain-containing protein [Candidatus Parcubacteria bacterium]